MKTQRARTSDLARKTDNVAGQRKRVRSGEGTNDGAVPATKLPDVPADVVLDRPSNQATARLAAEILGQGNDGFIVPTARQREAILVALVRAGYVIYGKAFDIIRVNASFDLADESQVRKHLDEIILYEIKSTSKAKIPADFRGYFFSLSTAELLAAQNLGPRYRFAFVNTRTRTHMELSLQELFARSRGIYPAWSVMF